MLLSIKSGTPSGSIRFGLWVGDTPPVNQGYTNTVPSTASNTIGQWIYAYFPTPIVVQPSKICRVTLAETANNDVISINLRCMEFIWDTDSNSLALTPFEGTAIKTYFDGSQWTDTSGSLMAFAVLLDSSREFDVIGTPGMMRR
jgi:hypothetical protein